MKADAIRPAGGASPATPANPSAWMLMLRGAIAIAFGVLAVLWPGLTLLVLVGLFAAYALLGGAVSIAREFRIRRTDG